MTAALALGHPGDPGDPGAGPGDAQARARAALDVAVRRAGRLAEPVQARPPLPVAPALAPLLPRGLRRGSTLGVTGGVASTSLTLALVGAASAAGSWCALVGLPDLAAESLTGFGLDLDRLAVVPAAALSSRAGTGTGAGAGAGAGTTVATAATWATALGALIDAVDVVVVRPPARLPDGDVRRLVARARSRGSVLLVLTPGGTGWPAADVRLTADHVAWAGVDSAAGHGRLRARQVSVRSTGRGLGSGRPAAVWLPSPAGGVAPVEPVVTPLRRVG